MKKKSILCSLLLACLSFSVLLGAGTSLILDEQGLTSQDVFALWTPDGERRGPRTCQLPDGTTVSVERVSTPERVMVYNLTVTPSSSGADPQHYPAILTHVEGGSSGPLTCDSEINRIYLANPKKGTVTAFDSQQLLLLSPTEAIAWQIQIDNWQEADLGPFALPLQEQGPFSGSTALQAKHGHVLIEWRTHGFGYSQAVYSNQGQLIEKLGPSALMLRTKESDSLWWELFYDEHEEWEPVSYKVDRLFSLMVVSDHDSTGETYSQVMARLSDSAIPPRSEPVTELDTIEPVTYMVALLTPTATTAEAKPTFCSRTPPDRARTWLGDNFRSDMASFSHDLLLRFTADLRSRGYEGNTLAAWFDSEIAPHEPMRSVIERYTPSSLHDDEWVADYQQALLALGRSELEGLMERHTVTQRVEGPEPTSVGGSN